MLLTKTVAQADPPTPFRLRTDRAGKIERLPAKALATAGGRAKRLISSQGKSIACFCDSISEPLE